MLTAGCTSDESHQRYCLALFENPEHTQQYAARNSWDPIDVGIISNPITVNIMEKGEHAVQRTATYKEYAIFPTKDDQPLVNMGLSNAFGNTARYCLSTI